MKDNQNAIAHACDVLAAIVKETPEISGIFSGIPLFVYTETDEDFAEKLEAIIQQNVGAAAFVKNDGFTTAGISDEGIAVSARFSVRLIASILLNAQNATSLTDLVVAIAKSATGASGDARFLSPFAVESSSVFESANSITREIIFTANLSL